MKTCLSFLLLFFFTFATAQQEEASSPIIFIYDASGSMWGQMDGKTKMEIARDVLSSTIDKLPRAQQIGLVAYGHRTKSDCEDVEVLVDEQNSDRSVLNEALKEIKPLGKTPLAFSASQVIAKLKESQRRATIILVTDGIESCGGDLCAVIRQAREAGVEFKLHIVGFGLKDSDTEQLKCAALAGEGSYFDAQDAEGLESVLLEATKSTIDEPDANITFYASKNGEAIDAYFRAFPEGSNSDLGVARTYADTGELYLPPGNYDFEVKPLEGSDVDIQRINGITTFEDSIVHRSVSFDAGKLEVMVTNNGEGWDAVVRIYPAGQNSNVAIGRTYGKTDLHELNPGLYDVEFGALVLKGIDIKPRINNILVKSNELVRVDHNYDSGIVHLGAKGSTGLIDVTINIVDMNSRRAVASGRTYTSDTSNPKQFILLPGTYEVTLSALGTYKGQRQKFTLVVETGQETTRMTDF